MRKYLKEGQYSIDQENILGKGAFGKVYRAYDHAQARWVAIKSINLQLLQIHGAEMKTIICNEISVMRKFTARMLAKPCPYLVKHYDCLRTDTHVYIVMELCQAGTLNDLISKQALTQQTVKSILKQVIAGLEYLDSLNISHRDLKPENIFVTVEFVNAKNVTYYKIGDFGFAAQKQTSSQVLGTYPFMAPEIYRREEYTSKVDVWSLGVIAYQLLFKELFFFGKNKWEIEKKVKDVQFSLEGRLKGRISAEMEDFISLCLSKDQLKRPRSCELMGLRLFSQGQTKLLVVFEAVEHELFFCELLRSMAEEVCEFGSRSSCRTEFMQIYLLKKSYSIVNLLAYSLLNKQNYLNVSEEMFGVLISQNHSKDYLVLCDKVTKESILVTSLFKEKYALFQHYLTKFALEDAKLVKSLIAADQLYADINAAVFKAELKNLSELLQKCPEYEVLKVKCSKLLQL